MKGWGIFVRKTFEKSPESSYEWWTREGIRPFFAIILSQTVHTTRVWLIRAAQKRYRIYSNYTIEPTRSVNRIKCRIMVWYVESLRHLDSAQCSFSWRNNVAGWRCNSKRKSEEQLEWKVKNKFEKWEHTYKKYFGCYRFRQNNFCRFQAFASNEFTHLFF